MIIVALVATMTATMVWQQWRAVQVEAAERARAQSAEMLTGALSWAALILREDAPGSDDLGDQWAQPLAEARLSTLLQAPSDADASRPDPFLSGAMVDAQAKYNLRRLVDAEGKLVKDEVELFARLCEQVNLSSGVAADIAGRLQRALAPAGAAGSAPGTPVMPRTLDQLRWLGIDPDQIETLRPVVDLLPEANTPINVNTAGQDVLAAVFGDRSRAQQVIDGRSRGGGKGYRTLDAVRSVLGTALPEKPAGLLDVKTRFVWLDGTMRLDDRAFTERVLLRRPAQAGGAITAMNRARVSTRVVGEGQAESR